MGRTYLIHLRVAKGSRIVQPSSEIASHQSPSRDSAFRGQPCRILE